MDGSRKGIEQGEGGRPMSRSLLLFTAAGAFLLAVAAPFNHSPAHAAHDEGVAIERTIKIEGSVERPRVIFIVPRARLLKGGLMSKSFVQDILEPVYPEQLVKEEKQNNPIRR